MKALDTAKECLKIAVDKKALDPVVFDLRGITQLTDFFVICSGSSNRHIKTIADSIMDSLKEKGNKVLHCESDSDNNWIVLDCFDIIIHIFSEELREHYRLEQLWGDAKMPIFE